MTAFSIRFQAAPVDEPADDVYEMPDVAPAAASGGSSGAGPAADYSDVGEGAKVYTAADADAGASAYALRA